MLKKMSLVASLLFAMGTTAHAADKLEQFNFNQAVQNAISQGLIDGSVKFYLAGTGGGQVIQKGLVSNKKTNGFAKSAEASCERALHSALIQFHKAAKAKGATKVVNIVSYYKSQTYSSTTQYQCGKGTAMAGVTLKGDLAR